MMLAEEVVTQSVGVTVVKGVLVMVTCDASILGWYRRRLRGEFLWMLLLQSPLLPCHTHRRPQRVQIATLFHIW